VNRVRFVESMNVFIYYKTLTIHLDDIAAIILQKTVNLSCQDRGKCLQLPHSNVDMRGN